MKNPGPCCDRELSRQLFTVLHQSLYLLHSMVSCIKNEEGSKKQLEQRAYDVRRQKCMYL